MIERFRTFFRSLSASTSEPELQQQLADARRRTAVPVFWLFGKTQTGKSSIVRYLTGATAAQIGNGFQACTKFSRYYAFPSTDAPLLMFQDTRGLDEPGYDPAEDIEHFDSTAHLVIVTAKVLDHAQDNVIRHLETIRAARPSRPIILVLTCLHEAYPHQQHPKVYPFDAELYVPSVPENLRRAIAEHERRFGSLVDVIVPVDLTQPEEGFEEPNYGGEHLKHVLLEKLPDAYRQTLLTLDELTHELQDAYLKAAIPLITGYSYLAAAAGAIPVPFLDLAILPGIQMKMVSELAGVYGQTMTPDRYKELAATMGIGLIARQAVRQVGKLIPLVGIAASAALAGASTFALGRAFCFYYQQMHEGHVPSAADLKSYFEKELDRARARWSRSPSGSSSSTPQNQ